MSNVNEAAFLPRWRVRRGERDDEEQKRLETRKGRRRSRMVP